MHERLHQLARVARTGTEMPQVVRMVLCFAQQHVEHQAVDWL